MSEHVAPESAEGTGSRSATDRDETARRDTGDEARRGAGEATRTEDSTNQGSAPGRPDTQSLVPAERARAFRERWIQLKGEFVDDPRDAVRRIDGLVGEVLDEIEQTFRRQRRELEAGIGDEHASTEDLRVAFGRYREFFDRLLSV
jgi:hypothetical protein